MDQTSFGNTRAYSGDSTELTYLRSRYYASGTGRFLTRDTWAGNISQPLSLNQWNYVNGNPINYTDPSGNSPACANTGTCGPDVTEWFRTEMSHHYDYGVDIRNKVMRMKALAVTITTITPCLDVFAFLSFVAIEQPFYDIVREFKIPKTNVPIGFTPLLTPNIANKVIDALGTLEYALYGVSVYYGQLQYDTSDRSCNTGGCAVTKNDKHPVISLCNQCRDASDLGNMMFGLGGAARGYSWQFVLASAGLFNVIDGDASSFLVDGAGAAPGWIIGAGGLYRNPTTFCWAVNVPIIGHDNTDQIQGCQVCNTATKRKETTPSSLISITNGSTIDDLQGRLNRKLDEVLKTILDKLR